MFIAQFSLRERSCKRFPQVTLLKDELYLQLPLSLDHGVDFWCGAAELLVGCPLCIALCVITVQIS